MSEKVLVAMSGGVDSGVTAMLMEQAGYDCYGVTMRLFDRSALVGEPSCCTSNDIADAAEVCRILGITHTVCDFSGCFEDAVIRRFAEAYENGCTPNPCVDCNRHLKFGQLFRKAQEMGCTHLATGHYARVEQSAETGRFLLKKAMDDSKDQSYVLWALTQEELSHTYFPLGSKSKPEIRRLAEEANLPVAHKHDSQDICFIPDGKYAAFLESYRKKAYPAGDFITPEGKVLGKHKGIIRYTIGQKKGLGLVLPEPLYVCAVNPKDNTVTLGKEELLFERKVTAHSVNLISVPKIEGEMRVTAKIRYRQKEEPATVTQPDADTLLLTFDSPQRAITAGQSLVLYDGDTVVGGGIIAK